MSISFHFRPHTSDSLNPKNSDIKIPVAIEESLLNNIFFKLFFSFVLKLFPFLVFNLIFSIFKSKLLSLNTCFNIFAIE